MGLIGVGRPVPGVLELAGYHMSAGCRDPSLSLSRLWGMQDQGWQRQGDRSGNSSRGGKGGQSWRLGGGGGGEAGQWEISSRI